MKTKLNFFTEKLPGTSTFVGKCKELPALVSAAKRNRSTALSAVKRLYGQKLKAGVMQTLAPGATTLPTPKPKKNVIRFLVDRSGSMGGLEAASAKALNSNLETIKQQAKATGQETLVEVVVFDSIGGRCRMNTLRSLGNVLTTASIGEHEIRADGGTPLWEATTKSIEALQSFRVQPGEDVAFVLMMITDGGNTDNHGLSTGLAALIKQVQATDLWTILFLTPPGAKANLVYTLGLRDGNVQEWEATVKGIESYAASNNLGFQSYYASRAAGSTSTNSFYTTDLSNLSTKQVKSALQDLSSQFKVLSVKSEADIRPFVESETGKTYTPGTAFYQLTKDEKNVQAYKELLIMEKGKKAIYGGPDARNLLGLPVGQNVKVRPGNHANFDLFVQSTSNNRKLVRGTKLLVKN